MSSTEVIGTTFGEAFLSPFCFDWTLLLVAFQKKQGQETSQVYALFGLLVLGHNIERNFD